jgi:hypothetical protein
MTEGLDRSLEAQITSKIQELISCMCVVEFKQEGDRRGMIERIESLILEKDFAESFNQSQFKVHLTSGDIVIVPGSAISAIESRPASIDPASKESSRKRRKEVAPKTAPRRAERGRKTSTTRTKTMLAKERKAIATEDSKATARVRTRRAKERRAKNG